MKPQGRLFVCGGCGRTLKVWWCEICQRWTLPETQGQTRGRVTGGQKKQFRTVRQIFEHYLPQERPIGGKELARQLLDDFRKALSGSL